jgi:hypothetical protein
VIGFRLTGLSERRYCGGPDSAMATVVLCSDGNTAKNLNHYVEVEVYGRLPK